MQKIDFVNKLEIIVDKLESVNIINILEAGFNQTTTHYQYNKINPLLFKSKSNFDQLVLIGDYNEIFENNGAIENYTDANLSFLSLVFSTTIFSDIISKPQAIAFYLFHKTLLQTLILTRNVLLSNQIFQDDFEQKINSGVILFQILIDSEGLEPEKYIKIFSALNDLISVVEKICDESDEKTEIILLDSGSDTNLGIKTGVETAKSLFLIFKEIWDFVVNFKYYKAEQNNKALLDSLSIRTIINKKVEEGILSKDEGIEYTHKIKTRTDDLISMKVLPKEIVNKTNIIENKRILSDFEGFKLIGGKD